MKQRDRIARIVAPFLNVAPESITQETAIDRRAIRGSVLVHRMYAQLAKEGFAISSPARLKTFGELLDTLDGDHNSVPQSPVSPEAPAVAPISIGIDIEHVDNMPDVTDFKADEFYRRNFTLSEISYCCLAESPRAGFAGKFAAKEAVVKADNTYRDIPFNRIEIANDPNGRPHFADFTISISHTDDTAVAVAVKAVIN